MLKSLAVFGAGALAGFIFAPPKFAMPPFIIDVTAQSEAAETGSSSWVEFNYTGRYPNDIFASCTISLAEPSRIIVVAVTHLNHTVQVTQIQRDGVDRTVETSIYTNNRFVSGHLQYASEYLPAGNYTYNVVFTPPSGIDEVAFCQCIVKAFAFGGTPLPMA